MSLTWKDALATVLVGAAAVVYALFSGGTTVAGLSGPRAVSVAVFALGVGACYTAKSQMQDVYGVGGRPRPPLPYVVLASALGIVMLVAGIIAILTAGTGALATLTMSMVALWVVATIRHAASRPSPDITRPAH